MTINQLMCFVEVTRGLSFRRAAERLHLSQPSVSAHVHSLEQELGALLFERSGRRVRLTRAGEMLLPYAENVLVAVDDARTAVDSLYTVPRGMLRIGTTSSLVGTLVPPVVRQIQLLTPDVTVHLSVSNSEGVYRGLGSGELDLGIAYRTHEDSTLEVVRLVDDEFLLVTAPASDALSSAVIDLEHLSALPVIVLEPHTGGRLALDAALVQRGIALRIMMELSSSEAIKGMVMAGVAPGFVSRMAVGLELETGSLREVPVADLQVHHAVVALFRASRTRTGPMRAGLRALAAAYPHAFPA